jgi:hypothetical protein
MLLTMRDLLENVKTLVSWKHSPNGRWRQKIIESPKNIESEEIMIPRATFGGFEVLNSNFQY